MVVAAPRDETSCSISLFTAIESGGPFTIRYPEDRLGRRSDPL
jgi:deoxyxylulose-5-phosphate synthase